MLSAVFYLETRDFLKRPPVLVCLALVIASIGYAGWHGEQRRSAHTAGLEAFVADKQEALDAWRTSLVELEAGRLEPSPYAANPANVIMPAVLPMAALGDFAIGYGDLHPASAELSPRRNLSSLFGRYQFDNPEALATGGFDVALVVLLIMPLLMIAVSFDVLATERGRGSLAMALSAPARLADIAWGRLLYRNGSLWLLAVASMAALVVANDAGGDRYARFFGWLLVSLCYGAFWLALIAFVIARFQSATQTAAVLTGLWFLLTLAFPGAVSSITEAVYPTPSRLALLSEIREVEGATNRELARLTDRFLTDHPELTVGDEGVPAFYRASYLSNDGARQASAPLVDDFERAHELRSRALTIAQYVSPAIITQRLLLELSEADLGRQHRFQREARGALFELSDALGPAIVSRNRITVDEFDALAPFTFEAEPAGSLVLRQLPPLVFLLAVAIVLARAAQRRLKLEEGWT